MPMLSIRQSLSISPFLGSIFPGADDLLEDAGVQSALKYVARRKKMENYRTMLDFLYCELYLEHRYDCERFYLDSTAPKLGELLSDQEIADRELVLMESLMLAHDLEERNRLERWSEESDPAVFVAWVAKPAWTTFRHVSLGSFCGKFQAEVFS
tara:strand:+ start:473 stop:934 length:462 start_codon:yes stop_codon:yes gene_type:complete